MLLLLAICAASMRRSGKGVEPPLLVGTGDSNGFVTSGSPEGFVTSISAISICKLKKLLIRNNTTSRAAVQYNNECILRAAVHREQRTVLGQTRGREWWVLGYGMVGRWVALMVGGGGHG